MPKPREVAVLNVRGSEFSDWESVWVQHRYGEAFAFFRFTAAEREPYANRWQALRFHPDDPCVILLARQIAMSGVIVTRQVAYDARRHGVELQGKGRTWWASKSSVDSVTGSFDGMSFEQVFHKVLAPYPVGRKIIGTLDPTPFAQLQAQKGEKVWAFLERIARPRGIVLGSDHLGNMVAIDLHDENLSETLEEGKNILRAQVIITKDSMYQKYTATGQAQPGQARGTKRSEVEALAFGTAAVYSHLITPAEQPVTEAEMKKRAEAEALWHEGAWVEAHITVQGWTKTNGLLWRTGECYNVISPMAMLHRVLALEEATFTQDRNAGTLTVLKLVLPKLLKIKSKFEFGEPLPPDPVLGEGQAAELGPPKEPPIPTLDQFSLPPGTRITETGEIVEINPGGR